MISRHIVRIKVMQQLYAVTRKEKTTLKQLTGSYNQVVENLFELFLLNVWYLTRIAHFSKTDKEQRASKLRPSTTDLAFKSHLANNEIIQSLLSNNGLKELNALHLIHTIGQNDFVKSLYRSFGDSDDYKMYVELPNPTLDDHREMIKNLYRFLTKNEHFNEIQTDFHSSWLEDKSLVVGAIKKTLKSAPVADNFYESYQPKGTAANIFGKELIEMVYQNDDELLELVIPFLQNWDVKRLAIIDLILLKMAVAEFLYFASIPTKVTLNEYVDISKVYSTDKSKSFINGVLDRMMKQFEKDGKIVKSGRGLC